MANGAETAAGYSRYLADWGWMGLFILACGVIVIIVVWLIRYERPKLNKLFEERDTAEKERLESEKKVLKDLVDDYTKLTRSYEVKVGTVAARLVDIYQQFAGHTNAAQRVIDQIAKGEYRVSIEGEILKAKDKKDETVTKILKDPDEM